MSWVEVAEYLAFREALADKWGDRLSQVSERAVVGQDIRNLPEEEPSTAFVRYVGEVEQMGQDWDISRIVHLFHERGTTPDAPEEVEYKVLSELAKLYRTEMAEFKKRFGFSMKKAVANERCLPHRFSTSKGCGFVFIPLRSEDLPHRHNLLLNFTALNKYDLKLDKCIGLTIIAEGNDTWCDIQWCPMNFPWKVDAQLETALAERYPFKPVRSRGIEHYGLQDLSG